jgi:putative aminopeptidase FrvX
VKLDATLQPWSVVADDAHACRERLRKHVLHWAARRHAQTRAETSTRTIAALDALARPIRTGILSVSTDATDRDRAEAASDDLWDAVAVVWSLVASLKSKDIPPLEHVLAELAECGRWLAAFPVTVARHDQEIARLFNQ